MHTPSNIPLSDGFVWGAATAAGRGSFTAAVEVRQQRQLLVSFLYHLAVQRNVKNPFETSDVVGMHPPLFVETHLYSHDMFPLISFNPLFCSLLFSFNDLDYTIF